MDSVVFACYSKACAPPPIGKGGSTKGGEGALQAVRPVIDAIVRAGGKPYVVGGYVRDKLVGKDSKDIDIEVHGISADALVRALKSQGRVDEVGKAFGVLKVSFGGEDLDVSLPRTDSKTGEGHTGFDVRVDPNMGIEAALARRDFTINAIAMDAVTGELVDPYKGALHLKANKLVAVSDAFSEDPLRVLRGVQFAARFGATMDDRTAALSRSLLSELDSVPIERVWGEFEKIGTKGTDFRALAKVVEQVGLQDRFGQVRASNPDLSGLSGERRTAVVLKAIGVDPAKIGATNAVTQRMEELDKLTSFSGSEADSRALARTVKLSTFSDAARLQPGLKFDPAVAEGPTAPIVSGKDLIKAGMKPGPEMGQRLKDITAAQDRGEITSVEDALRNLGQFGG